MPTQREFDRMIREAQQAAAQQPVFEVSDFRDDILAGEDADSIAESLGRPLSAREEALFDLQVEELTARPALPAAEDRPTLPAAEDRLALPAAEDSPFEVSSFRDDILAGEDADSIAESLGRPLTRNEEALLDREMEEIVDELRGGEGGGGSGVRGGRGGGGRGGGGGAGPLPAPEDENQRVLRNFRNQRRDAVRLQAGGSAAEQRQQEAESNPTDIGSCRATIRNNRVRIVCE